MTQYQYDTIMKLIVNGAPALANELCSSLADVVNERNDFKAKLEKIKSDAENAKNENKEE